MHYSILSKAHPQIQNAQENSLLHIQAEMRICLIAGDKKGFQYLAEKVRTCIEWRFISERVRSRYVSMIYMANLHVFPPLQDN